MKEKIVCIEWDDACFNSGYYDKSTPDRYEQLKTKTIGQVIKSDKKQVIVAMDSWISEDRVEYRHITTIPRKMIKKVIKLEA